MKIIVATGNQNKVREISQCLGEGFTVVSMKDIGLDLDIEENGTTFGENAYIKAKAVYDRCHQTVLADDSGLVVNALGGAPGVYSARYAGEGHDDSANNQKLLRNMEGVEDRSAYFACAICCILEDGSHFTVEGRCHGTIAQGLLGSGGFGYDPLFYVEEYQKTFGELSPEEKNAISHRGQALEAFTQELKKRTGR